MKRGRVILVVLAFLLTNGAWAVAQPTIDVAAAEDVGGFREEPAEARDDESDDDEDAPRAKRRQRPRAVRTFTSVGATLPGALPVEGLAPTLTKTFLPDVIGPGSTSTIRFVISNPDSISPLTGLTFTDNLPGVPDQMVIASVPAVSSSCGGTVTAPAGGSSIVLADGQLGASASCTITVNVTAPTAGVYTNTTSQLLSDGPDGNVATDDLTVSTTRPGFSKVFSPTTVPLGSRATLTLTIDNSLNPSQVSSLNFVDNLPSGLVVASPNNASNTCMSGFFTGGILTAVPGTSVISLALGGGLDEAAVDAFGTCSIVVDVVATGGGLLGNTSGELTSFVGTSGKASAPLEVTFDTLALSKRFLNDPVPPGGQVPLEFTVRNFDRTDSATAITFTDDLDAVISGLAATGLPAADVCGAGSTLTGTSVLTLTGGTLPPEGFCTFSVTLDVPPGAVPGVFTNTTSTIAGDVGGVGEVGAAAFDDLFVSPAPVLTKEFTDDPIGAGDKVNLNFTIQNTSTTSAATNLAFLDELTTFLPFPISATLPAMPCGAGSSLTLVTVATDRQALSLTDGTLDPGDSCSFDVEIDIPMGFPSGAYLNVTGDITGTVDGSPVVGPGASDTLLVAGAPNLQKLFTDDPVEPGDTVTLEFQLSQDDNALGDASAIAFSDDLDATLSGLVATGLPMTDVCGAGSTLDGTSTISLTGGFLGVDETCTFSVILQTPVSALPGTYLNTTSAVAAMVGGTATTGSAATDQLTIGGLSFSKEFTDDPLLPGATGTLEFTIQNTSTMSSATGMSFADVLDADLPGLTATNLPAEPCGVGSSITGTSILSFVGGNLGPSETCIFSVDVLVPGGTGDGDYLNVTSSLTGTFGGVGVVVDPATDVLTVDSNILLFDKEFTDDPVAPGDNVTLEFTISNQDLTETVAQLAFVDDLDAALSGLAAIGLPINDVCGAGSSISGTSVLSLTSGSLGPGESCVFSVTLSVPASVPLGTLATNTTSTITGVTGSPPPTAPRTGTAAPTFLGGVPVSGLPAEDDLLIDFVDFSKSFADPGFPGLTTTLTFTIDNLSGSAPIADLGFTDDLDAVLTGMVATGLPLADVCGAGSSISGTSSLTFSDGNLLAGGSCSFNVDIVVPAGAAPGVFTNTTSDLTQNGLFAAAAAVDDLTVEPPPTFAKSFSPDVIVAGAVSTLSFFIDNAASTVAATALDFTDNLPANVFVAVPANASTTCGGTLTAVGGSGVISLTGGAVGAGMLCTVQVDTTSMVPGAYVNTSGDLTSSSGNSGSASDTLTVTIPPPPGFSKEFAPDTILATQVSTLTFTIDNTGALVDVTALDFTDNLPAGLVVGTPSNAVTTCIGGTLTAVSGSSVISYTGGTVPALSTCTVAVDTTSASGGTLVNVTGDLTSSAGNSGTATDTLVVSPAPLFSKVFAPDAIQADEVSTLTFTIDNTGGVLDVTGLDFTDNLPADLLVASPANAATTCTGGTLTAVSGSGVISYTGGTVLAASACTIDVDLTSSEDGDHVNLTGDLTSDAGNSGTATDTLTVSGLADLELTISAVYDPAVAHTVEVYDISITNNGPSTALNAMLVQELPVGTYFLGVEPSTLDCSDSGPQVTCDLGDLAVGETVDLSVGAFVDARFDGTLATEALAASDLVDPDGSNDEMHLSTSVARPRSLLATTRADGTEILVAVAKEADETIGLVFAEAAGGGNRDYSVTGNGFRTVALAEVPNFSDTAAPEVAALASGFDGSVLVDVVDADSTNLIGSYPVAGSWVPIDLAPLEGFVPAVSAPLVGGGMTPTLALLMKSLDDGGVHLVYLDTLTGVVVLDTLVESDTFPIDLTTVASFTGSSVAELAVLIQNPDTEATTVQVIDPELGTPFSIKTLTAGRFPIGLVELEDFDGLLGGGSAAEIAALQRDATTGGSTAEIFDAAFGADSPPVDFSSALLAEAFTRIDHFGDGSASELAVGGRSGMGLVVESRDAGSGMIVGTIVIGGSLLDLDLAVHPGFAGGADPAVSVLFELLDSPTEVSVFDPAGGAPLFSFILP